MDDEEDQEYLKFKKRKVVESRFYFYGLHMSFGITKFKMMVLWYLPSIRAWLAKKEKEKVLKKFLLWKFIEGWQDGRHFSWVFCETCGDPGFDYNSDSHGWIYNGGHIWTCRKCSEND